MSMSEKQPEFSRNVNMNPTSSNPNQRPISLQNSNTRNRLPTLAETLARRTAPPVDLYCFYLFLQREGSEDSLDFWLDVQQHENLCRAYFKDLRKSGRSVQQDWPAFYQMSRERGSIYNRMNGIDLDENLGGNHPQEQDPDYNVNQDLTQVGGDGNEYKEKAPQHEAEAGDGLGEGLERTSTTEPGPRFPGDPDFPLARTSENSFTRNERRTLLSKRASHAPTVISRNQAINRVDLIASAERIYARYLLPGSEKEIYLPSNLRILNFPVSSSNLPHPNDVEQQRALARIPDMFHSQKEYVFRTMESDVFPRFLRAKAFGNLTPISALVRLSLGLLALWAALATGFAFIFLDNPREKRLWVILPFSIAFLLLFSHQYHLDPILVLFKQSETTPFHLIKIREKYVLKLLRQRAFGVLAMTTLLTAALTCLFVFVPGHRL